MENKTAVEFLVDKLNNYFGNNDFIITYQNEISKALELEKQQHKKTWFNSTAQFDNSAEMTYKKDFEQYYSETYKKTEQDESI